MGPVCVWNPTALLVPLLTRQRSQGCTIPVLRDAGACIPAGISILPAYTQGL